MTRSPRFVVASAVRRVRSAVARLGDDEEEGVDLTDEPSDANGPAEAERRAIETEAERARYNPDAANFDVLVAALQSDDPETRELATVALAGTPTPSRVDVTDAVPALVRRLDDDRLSVRRYGAEALARIAPADPAVIADEAPALVDHLDAHNVRVSANVATTLADAAASFPDEIAPLVFRYVDVDVRTTTRRNAFSILEPAANASPDVVEPIVPAMVELLDRSATNGANLLRALAAVADQYPELLAPAAPALARSAERGDEDTREAAIAALSRLGLEDPSAAVSAVPALANYLAVADPPHGGLAARALVRVVERHPDQHDRVLDELGGLEGMERLYAARALVEANGSIGAELAETALEGSSLRRYLDR